MTGIDCAIAGEAMDMPAAPAADAFKKSRRFMNIPPPYILLEPGLSELSAPKKDYRPTFRTRIFPRAMQQNLLRSKKARP
jgi:hypothetical protein